MMPDDNDDDEKDEKKDEKLKEKKKKKKKIWIAAMTNYNKQMPIKQIEVEQFQHFNLNVAVFLADLVFLFFHFFSFFLSRLLVLFASPIFEKIKIFLPNWTDLRQLVSVKGAGRLCVAGWLSWAVDFFLFLRPA